MITSNFKPSAVDVNFGFIKRMRKVFWSEICLQRERTFDGVIWSRNKGKEVKYSLFSSKRVVQKFSIFPRKSYTYQKAIYSNEGHTKKIFVRGGLSNLGFIRFFSFCFHLICNTVFLGNHHMFRVICHVTFTTGNVKCIGKNLEIPILKQTTKNEQNIFTCIEWNP